MMHALADRSVLQLHFMTSKPGERSELPAEFSTRLQIVTQAEKHRAYQLLISGRCYAMTEQGPASSYISEDCMQRHLSHLLVVSMLTLDFVLAPTGFQQEHCQAAAREVAHRLHVQQITARAAALPVGACLGSMLARGCFASQALLQGCSSVSSCQQWLLSMPGLGQPSAQR